MADTMALVDEVNALLLAGEPGNVSKDEHSGYTGYKPQPIIDAMNKAFGIGSWGFEEISSEIVPGEKSGLAIAQVKVWLKGVEFQPVAWGQSRVTRGDVGDAKKGAQTDAIKKALSYFSIGNRAYHGLLKDNAHNNGATTGPATNRITTPPSTKTAGNTENKKDADPAAVERVRTLIGRTFGFTDSDFEARWGKCKKFVLKVTVADPDLTSEQLAALSRYAQEAGQKPAA